MTSEALPTYKDVFLDRHWPKDRAGLLYSHVPLPWRASLRRDDATNQIIVDKANVDLMLTENPELSGLIWWETRSERLWLVGKLPDEDVFARDSLRPMTLDDVTSLHIFIQKTLPRIDRNTVYWCIRNTAKRYHPFRFDIDFPPPIDLDTCWDDLELEPGMEGQA